MKRIVLFLTFFVNFYSAQAYDLDTFSREDRYLNRYKAEELVELLYDGILFRKADLAGLDHYTSKLRRYGLNGLTQIAGELASSSEFQREILRKYRPQTIVENIFRVFFNRNPEREGLHHYSRMIRFGNSVQAIKELVDSNEFKRKNLERRHR
ncbi:MAG: DUF4214 domain-containing protein [Halobacteriovoraceae bacterium]|nr:DUF4214 domain-containing protein [Halobacteriovoraceae bacterium]